MPVNTYLYDAEGRDHKVDLSAETLKSLGEQRLLWVDVIGRDQSELEQVTQVLGLDKESLEILLAASSTRLQNFGAFMQLAVETAPAVRDDAPSGGGQESGHLTPHTRLDLLIGKAWLLTVHEKEVSFIEDFRSEDRPETMIGSLTTYDFAASLLDMHLEAYFEEIARIELHVDKLDEQALARASSNILLGRMVRLRRRVSRLRNLLSVQRAVFYGLSRPDLQTVADAGASPHFQVLANRFERAIDEVEHVRDLVVGSFELFASRTALETNELVKVLTFLTAVIGFCAAVAGIFGMNFETTLFSTGDTGFYLTIASLIALTLLLWVTSRLRGWL